MKKLFHNKKKLWISLAVFALIIWNLAITAILSTTILQLNYMNDSLFRATIQNANLEAYLRSRGLVNGELTKPAEPYSLSEMEKFIEETKQTEVENE